MMSEFGEKQTNKQKRLLKRLEERIEWLFSNNSKF